MTWSLGAELVLELNAGGVATQSYSGRSCLTVGRTALRQGAVVCTTTVGVRMPIAVQAPLARAHAPVVTPQAVSSSTSSHWLGVA